MPEGRTSCFESHNSKTSSCFVVFVGIAVVYKDKIVRYANCTKKVTLPFEPATDIKSQKKGSDAPLF